MPLVVIWLSELQWTCYLDFSQLYLKYMQFWYWSPSSYSDLCYSIFSCCCLFGIRKFVTVETVPVWSWNDVMEKFAQTNLSKLFCAWYHFYWHQIFQMSWWMVSWRNQHYQGNMARSFFQSIVSKFVTKFSIISAPICLYQLVQLINCVCICWSHYN